MSHHLRSSLTPLLLTAGLILVPASSATAAAAETAEPVNLSLQPVDHPGSYFALTMEPGESQTLTFAQANHGESDLDASIYPADAYSLVNGGFGAKEDGADTTGTTTWLDSAAQEVTLPAGDTQESTLTLTVPPETEPGQYITSLVLQNAEPVAGSGDVALNQTVRQAMPITIEVPGELTPAFEFGEAGHQHAAGRSVVDLELTNTGNEHLEPAGDFTIRDDSGEIVSEAEVTMGDVIAGTQTTAEMPLEGALQVGDYTLSGSMTDEPSGVSAAAVDLPFSVEKAEESIAVDSQQDALPGIDQDALPGNLVYILGGAVLVLLGLVVYLILRTRKAGASR
ncbi:WxL protein peptidoglycan domain-containing protein [Nesterenkonia lutea]|uniref:WxL Interacting Protein peptidoglycan binding domain-containing protein n=1 Tax=Nesterenkonia lutea TaxID=272919 RepID=A0ABR9JBS6_9MICC|nr:DUF916 domain-containing protein [Nesterenkonia lutea]MBE1523375.1 hypothetical protein [Nesterenkonia lutea]